MAKWGLRVEDDKNRKGDVGKIEFAGPRPREEQFLYAFLRGRLEAVGPTHTAELSAEWLEMEEIEEAKGGGRII